jgi:hypothetical protein
MWLRIILLNVLTVYSEERWVVHIAIKACGLGSKMITLCNARSLYSSATQCDSLNKEWSFVWVALTIGLYVRTREQDLNFKYCCNDCQAWKDLWLMYLSLSWVWLMFCCWTWHVFYSDVFPLAAHACLHSPVSVRS